MNSVVEPLGLREKVQGLGFRLLGCVALSGGVELGRGGWFRRLSWPFETAVIWGSYSPYLDPKSM